MAQVEQPQAATSPARLPERPQSTTAGTSSAPQTPSPSTSQTGQATATETTPPPTALPNFVGHSLKAVLVEIGGRRTVIRPSTDATFNFYASGQFLSTDGFGGQNGRYVFGPGNTTVVFSKLVWSLAGYGGHDPGILAMMQAVLRLETGGSTANVTVYDAGKHVLVRARGAAVLFAVGAKLPPQLPVT